MLRALTIPATAARLGVTRTRIRQLIRAHRLELIAVDRELLVPVDSIEAYGAQRVAATDPRPAPPADPHAGFVQFHGHVFEARLLYIAYTFPDGQWEIVGFTDSPSGGRALVAWLAANAPRLPAAIEVH
jgi:hypothetical protein